MNELAIRAEGLSKSYQIGAHHNGYKTLRESIMGLAAGPQRAWNALRQCLQTRPASDENTIWALKDISFEIQRGDVVGIIGRNGAGKSTLLKVLSRITEPTSGFVDIAGRVGSLLEVGTGFHPELTGRENIFLNGAILGMGRAEIHRKFDEIVDFSDVEKFIDTPVKHYSSGMYLRLAFSVAAHMEPEVLLVDEVLAVGDASFQNKCLGRMQEVAKHGRTVLFVSHNMGAIRSLCNKGMYLEDGGVAQFGDVSECISRYFHAIGAVSGVGEDLADGCRSGTGFGRVMLNDGASTTIDQSEGFEISTIFRVQQDLSGFHLFATLEDMFGRRIFQLREESPVLGMKHCPLGDHHVRIRVPPLWLIPGLYAFHFKITTWGQAGSRYVSDKFPIDVKGTNSHVDTILHPQVEWAISSADAPRLTAITH